tara:strand:- start:308 stop:814 length:507 start_codon:yes stop_codon:yes gene_type:complete
MLKTFPSADVLTGPVPGMSLVAQPKNGPWESPPEINTVEEAAMFYTETLLDPDKQDNILLAIDKGAPIDTLAEVVTVSSTMNGVHSLDIAFLVNPVVRELFRLLADISDIEYLDSANDLNAKERLPYRIAKKIISDVVNDRDESPEIQKEIDKNINQGLMAKPSIRNI